MTLPDDKDWLYRPVDRGYCVFSELKDGSLDLYDVAEMNDLIDVRDENERRLQAALERDK